MCKDLAVIDKPHVNCPYGHLGRQVRFASLHILSHRGPRLQGAIGFALACTSVNAYSVSTRQRDIARPPPLPRDSFWKEPLVGANNYVPSKTIEAAHEIDVNDRERRKRSSSMVSLAWNNALHTPGIATPN